MNEEQLRQYLKDHLKIELSNDRDGNFTYVSARILFQYGDKQIVEIDSDTTCFYTGKEEA